MNISQNVGIEDNLGQKVPEICPLHSEWQAQSVQDPAVHMCSSNVMSVKGSRLKNIEIEAYEKIQLEDLCKGLS